MTSTPLIPKDEAARLAALEALLILDTAEEPVFDAIVALAASICETPIALISLVDRDRQWFKARIGLDVRETPRDVAFCAHAIVDPDPTEIPDASNDPRFIDNPLVVGDPNIRFYAGRPLQDRQGHALGTLCVIDRIPRELSPAQRASMEHLATVVMRLFEARGEMQHSNAAVRASEARVRMIADNVPAAVCYIDAERRYRFNNLAYTHWLDRSIDQITGRSLRELHGDENFLRIEPYLERALAGEPVAFEINLDLRGERRHLSGNYVPERGDDGTVIGVYGLIQDSTAMVVAQESLLHMAQHDALTGLVNRSRLTEVLNEAEARGRRHGTGSALLYLDIDHFKQINDGHGHAAGDAVLYEFARRLLAIVRGTDTVARLGGDEFVIVLEDLNDAQSAVLVAGKILEAMHTPFNLESISLTIGVSIGIAFSRRGQFAPETLLREADRALYAAKTDGRNSYRLADNEVLNRA